jgi:hypothetical protein
MAHIYKLRRDKLLQLIEAENSWWLPPPSFLKPPTPSACVVKTVSDLFVRNPGSRDDLDNRGCAPVPRRGFSAAHQMGHAPDKIYLRVNIEKSKWHVFARIAIRQS